MCDCIKQVNEELAKSQYPNTMVEPPLFGTPVAFVVTCKRDENVRAKPKVMMASHCPFCGEKYPKNAGTLSEIFEAVSP